MGNHSKPTSSSKKAEELLYEASLKPGFWDDIKELKEKGIEYILDEANQRRIRYLPEDLKSVGTRFTGLYLTHLQLPKELDEALTKIESLFPICELQSPPASLSRISESAVCLSGTRSKASAKHIKTIPSSVDKENSLSRASTPPFPT